MTKGVSYPSYMVEWGSNIVYRQHNPVGIPQLDVFLGREHIDLPILCPSRDRNGRTRQHTTEEPVLPLLGLSFPCTQEWPISIIRLESLG